MTALAPASALPVAPGSVPFAWACACGAELRVPVHASVTDKLRGILTRAHRGPRCADPDTGKPWPDGDGR